MTKYMIIKSFPISKHHTNTEMYCYADSEKQADLIVDELYKRISNLATKLRTKYYTYLKKHPHCKMNKYINGLFNLNFLTVEVPKYSHNLLHSNTWLMTDYPFNYDVATDEIRLNHIKKHVRE